jgi:hypothetical protein
MTRRDPGAAGLLVIDGYNVLLGLTEPEGPALAGAELPRARARLIELLTDWSEARERDVVVVWDGRTGPWRETPPPSSRLRNVWVEPPAEADDFVVHEAEAALRTRRVPLVVTRDKDLRRRLPAGSRSFPLKTLRDDLAALAGGPLSLAHVTGVALDELPASPGPVDPARLPRRRRRSSPPQAASDEPPRPPAGSATGCPPARPPARPATPRPPAGPPRIEPDREAKRRRWERAQERRRRRGR